jgi:hypothetical protein
MIFPPTIYEVYITIEDSQVADASGFASWDGSTTPSFATLWNSGRTDLCRTTRLDEGLAGLMSEKLVHRAEGHRVSPMDSARMIERGL